MSKANIEVGLGAIVPGSWLGLDISKQTPNAERPTPNAEKQPQLLPKDLLAHAETISPESVASEIQTIAKQSRGRRRPGEPVRIGTVIGASNIEGNMIETERQVSIGPGGLRTHRVTLKELAT